MKHSLPTLVLGLIAACGPAMASPMAAFPTGVRALPVDDFHYQLQDIDLDAIGRTRYDMVVIDYSRDGSDATAFTTAEISALRRSPGGEKIVLAYLSIGEAEAYRFYWNESWDAVGDGQPDRDAPTWLDLENPDWEGNYKVRYWHPEWQRVIFGGPDSYLGKILAAGFDGAYLDVVDAYEFYEGTGRETASREMVDFVLALAAYARSVHPGFLIFPQNAAQLASGFPEYLASIDGLGQEDVFYGYPDEGSPSPQEFLAEVTPHLDWVVAAGKTVLVIGYTTDPEQLADHHARAREMGYVPFATTQALDTLPLNLSLTP